MINSGPLRVIDVYVPCEAGEDVLVSFSENSFVGMCRDRAVISSTKSGGLLIMPHSRAMACAVSLKSPVT